MILNLTQYPATPEQVAAGVIDVKGGHKAALARMLTARHLPSRGLVVAMAEEIASFAHYEYGASAAMLGGAPWLMRALEDRLDAYGIEALYAFSVRESTEKTLPAKTSVFRHVGFVPAR